MDSTPSPQTVRFVGDAAPEGLLEAFWAYDRALLTNDVAALDALFAAGADTIRGDGATIVVGHEHIARFRAARTALPTRAVTSVAVQCITADAALVVAAVASSAGAKGMQTQLWRRADDGWKVTAAHVSAPVSAIDRTVWRVVGAPLKPATREGGLSGETVAVKDLFAVEGQVVGAGVARRANDAPIEAVTAPAVASLLAAGASVTGVAQTDQLAYSIAGVNSDYGTPLNVQAPDRLPGGSSSGPASAVAQGLASIGLGTDTAGSIRVPASYQGLWGIRTTRGLVPMTGVLGLAPSFDAVGWVARDGATLRRVAEVLTPDARRPGRPEPVWSPELATLASEHLRLGFVEATRRLGAAQVGLGADLQVWFGAFRTVQAHEAWHLHGPWITAHPGALGDDVRDRFEAASRISAEDADVARRIVDDARATLRDLLRERVLLLPAAAGTPPLRSATAQEIEDDRGRTLRLTCLASIAGLPAVVAPLLRADGQSVGLCFVGREGSDLDLIDVARLAADRLTDAVADADRPDPDQGVP